MKYGDKIVKTYKEQMVEDMLDYLRFRMREYYLAEIEFLESIKEVKSDDDLGARL